MSDKPSYLGLLNAIALNETRAHEYLKAWIEASPDPEVRAVLSTVCLREGEHGISFAKRIDELGYSVREKDNPRAEEQLACAASTDLSDLEKIEAFGLHELDKVLAGFDTVFSDHSIDIQTGALLGRYIAEEFDTARLLKCCYDQLASRSQAKGDGTLSAQLTNVSTKVDELQRTVDELRQIVCAQSMPADAS